MLDSQSAGWFFKRTQNHLPSQNTPTNSTWTIPQTVDSVSREPRFTKLAPSQCCKRCQRSNTGQKQALRTLGGATLPPASVSEYGIAYNFIDFLLLSNYSILPCIFQGNSVFCTIMLLFCKAILLWQHWWFWFFSKSRWLVSKGLSDKMIVIEIKCKIIFKAISHWKQFCFWRNNHFFFKAITL